MNPDDAEEYTQALGQSVAGAWRQVLLAKRLGVPKALGMTTRQWVEQYLGGYVQMNSNERKAVTTVLAGEGLPNTHIADVLGVDESTVRQDLGRKGSGNPDTHGAARPELGPSRDDVSGNPDMLDAVAALAADEKVRAEHDRQAKLTEDREAKRHDDWYTPRWLFDQLGITFDLDVCAPVDAARRSVPARRYYTQDDDGLEQPWDGLVWCNPPYSAPQPWMQRWAEHDNGMLLSVVSAKTGRMAPHWRAADRIIMFAGMVFDRPDGTTEAPYLPLTLAARGPAADLLVNIDHKWAGPVLQRIA